MYEKARNTVIDHRNKINIKLSTTLYNHGVAGLFINPEHALSFLSPKRERPNLRRNIAFYCSHIDDNTFETIATSLAEGVGVSSTARIQKVTNKTVLYVLVKAAKHIEKVSNMLLKNIKVSECQLDEMWSFIGKKEKNLTAIEKLQEILGDAWIWIAFDAVNKIFLSTVIGKRNLHNAVNLIEKVKRVTAGMPDLFSSDQLKQYENSLLRVYGKMVYPIPKPASNRTPTPLFVPPDDLKYVQVVKEYENNRVKNVSRKIIFGDPIEIDRILKTSIVSKKINTSYVERGNGIIRHMDARCNRKTLRFSKCKPNHEHQLILSQTYYHLCIPHKSLSKRYKQPTTPFMAAGLTDHVWNMRELLQCHAEKLKE